MLLTVESKGDDVGHVRVYADAILHAPASQKGHQSGYSTSRYSQPSRIYAMSLIGSEQSLRAIAAGCALQDDEGHTHMRTKLEVRGPNNVITGVWEGPWRCRAQVLVPGAMHMVAMPEVSVSREVVKTRDETTAHVIIPDRGREPVMESDFLRLNPDKDERAAIMHAVQANLRTAIYERLMLAYTTPLLPLNNPGMSEDDRFTAQHWRDVIVEQVIAEAAWWEFLKPHPDQSNAQCEHWLMGGVLTMHENDLDTLVCSLVQRGKIRIPAAPAAPAEPPHANAC